MPSSRTCLSCGMVSSEVTRMTPSVSWLASALVQLAGLALPCRTADTAAPIACEAHQSSTPRRISTAHGLSRPLNIRSIRPARRPRRWPGRWYSRSPSSRSTLARVSGATSGRPLTTFETVGSETPASAAIAASVGRRRCVTPCSSGAPSARRSSSWSWLVPTGLVLGTSLPLPRCHPLERYKSRNHSVRVSYLSSALRAAPSCLASLLLTIAAGQVRVTTDKPRTPHRQRKKNRGLTAPEQVSTMTTRRNIPESFRGRCGAVPRRARPKAKANNPRFGPPSGDDHHAQHQKVRRRDHRGGRGACPRCLQQQQFGL